MPGVDRQIHEAAASVGARFEEQAASHAETRREQLMERRRNQSRTRSLEALKAELDTLLERDALLVAATDTLFGEPKDSQYVRLIQDGESRPGKGEAEVERVCADSRFVPLGETEDGIEKFGFIRLWGIDRGVDPGGGNAYSEHLNFDRERGPSPNFFDVFSFDGYDISYAVGVSSKPAGTDDEPVGADTSGRKIYGQRVTESLDGDPSSVDDLLKFTTISTLSRIWMTHTFEQLSNPEKTDEERTELLDWLRKSIRINTAELDKYEGALNELANTKT